MTGKLPSSASVAQATSAGRLHAPAAARNLAPLCDLLTQEAPHHGQALEIASGTGQHVTAFATALPKLIWQPTEIDTDRQRSIDLHVSDAGLENVRPAEFLNAAEQGWHKRHGPQNLVVVINLLHLISATAAMSVITEAMAALVPEGRFIVYGPFMRGGALTSEGDARFHMQLNEADPAIGYKNDEDIDAWLRAAGASEVRRIEMPANNLAFITTR